ncbi:MAG: DUF5615 family PIN-like protein, partial [Phycisphaerales bacterium]
MKFLADENVPGIVVGWLREHGHDCAWIAEESPGCDDPPILARSHRQQRILLTHDLDFADLVFRDQAPAYSIILLRMGKLKPHPCWITFSRPSSASAIACHITSSLSPAPSFECNRSLRRGMRDRRSLHAQLWRRAKRKLNCRD